MNQAATSVTNDAENVVQYLFNPYGDRKIIYRDSEGEWGELCHDRGVFTSFGPQVSKLPEGVAA